MAENDLLITPEEVIATAFPGGGGLTPAAISPVTILAAQQKFVRPVLNGLYDALVNGKYAEFTDGYVKPPLALYVRLLMLPQLAYSVGVGGITALNPAGLDPAGDKGLRVLCRRARSEALALMKTAAEHLERNPDSFPEYDPEQNILREVNIASQFVL